MSARKWPFYALEVGEAVTIEQPPKQLQQKVYRHAARFGKKFSAKRIQRFKRKSPLLIRRIA